MLSTGSMCLGFSSCSRQTQQQAAGGLYLWHMGLETLQNVGSSAEGIEPASHALAGEFLTTGPPGSPEGYFFILGLLSV